MEAHTIIQNSIDTTSTIWLTSVKLFSMQSYKAHFYNQEILTNLY